MNAGATNDAALTKQVLGLGRLAQLELDVRQADSPIAVAFIAANDTHRVVSYDHALVWLAETGRIVTISGGLKIDPAAPQIRWYTECARHLAASTTAPDIVPVDAARLPSRLRDEAARYLPAHTVWIPCTGPKSQIAGGLFLLRDTPVTAPEQRLLSRLGSAYGSAITALSAPSHVRTAWWSRKSRWLAAAAVAALIALATPMHMIALVEAKVVPADPKIVAAPIDGVIQRVLVTPNEAVEPGRQLVRYDLTELAAAEDVAARRVNVLFADRRRAEAQGVRDPKARAEIGTLMARLAEGEIEFAHAQNRRERAAVTAQDAGIALLDDPIAWEGRPVRVGERILAIADPRRVRLEIYVPTEDAVVAETGADVDFFLASAPASPIRARILKISHEARALPNQTVAFVAEAAFDGIDAVPRLGLTGTAKIYGARAPFAYLLARKPLAAIRRLLGM
jgi:HlyD family secretion protein